MSNLELLDEKQNNRREQGLAIYNNGLVERIEKDTFLVKGKYQVDILDDTYYICQCNDYRYRNQYQCKHIVAVQFYQLLNNGGA